MSDTRNQRQRAIAAMLRAEPMGSQEDVTEKLSALGFAATQATVSRDLDQLGAVKVKRGGALRYALPDQIGDSDWAGTRLERLLAEWVVSQEVAGSLIILRTPPGSAHVVGIAIDQARPEDIAGTIAGDDTLFLAVRDGFEPVEVLARWRSLCGSPDIAETSKGKRDE